MRRGRRRRRRTSARRSRPQLERQARRCPMRVRPRAGIAGMLALRVGWPTSSPTSTASSPAAVPRRSVAADRDRRRERLAETSRDAVVDGPAGAAVRRGACRPRSARSCSTDEGSTDADARRAAGRGQRGLRGLGRRRTASTFDPRFGIELDDGAGRAGRHRRSPSRSATCAKAGPRPTQPDAAYAAVAARRPALRLSRRHGVTPATGEPLLEFLEVMRRLRAECPWKAGQTHRSLARYLLEETHETLEAIDTGDADAPARGARRPAAPGLLPRRDRRGGRRRSPSTTSPRDIIEKLLRRNPHVFGDAGADRPAPAAEVNELWEAIKAAGEAARLGHRRPPAGRCPRCCTPTRCSTGSSGRASRRDGRRPDDRRPTWATGCSRWSPRPAPTGVDPEQALRDAVRRLGRRLSGG